MKFTLNFWISSHCWWCRVAPLSPSRGAWSPALGCVRRVIPPWCSRYCSSLPASVAPPLIPSLGSVSCNSHSDVLGGDEQELTLDDLWNCCGWLLHDTGAVNLVVLDFMVLCVQLQLSGTFYGIGEGRVRGGLLTWQVFSRLANCLSRSCNNWRKDPAISNAFVSFSWDWSDAPSSFSAVSLSAWI